MAGILDNTHPEFRSRLLKLIAASGGRIGIGNAFRTRAQQAALFKAKPHLAAPPGRSNHERGLAADLVYSGDGAAWAHANAARFGLKFPMLSRAKGKKYEPWHVELADAPPTAYASQPARGEVEDHDHDHGDEPVVAGKPADEEEVAEDPHDPAYQLIQLERILTQQFDFSTPQVDRGTAA